MWCKTIASKSLLKICQCKTASGMPIETFLRRHNPINIIKTFQFY